METFKKYDYVFSAQNIEEFNTVFFFQLLIIILYLYTVAMNKTGLFRMKNQKDFEYTYLNIFGNPTRYQ